MAKHSLKSLPAMNVLLSSFQKGFRPTMATSGSLHHPKNIPGKHRHCLPTCSAYRGGQEFSVGFSEMSLPLLIRPGLSLLGLPVEPASPHSVSFFKAHNRLHGLQQEPSLMLPVGQVPLFYALDSACFLPSISAHTILSGILLLTCLLGKEVPTGQ